MKKYDFEKAHQIITEQKDLIKVASLGMHEDWFWTAETVFEDEVFIEKLIETEGLEIGGLSGSSWATPALNIEYKDGTERMIPCYVGESSESIPPLFEHGVLSAPVQKSIVPLEKEYSK